MDWKPPAAWPFRLGGSADARVMQSPVRAQQFTDLTLWDPTGGDPTLAASAIVRQYTPDIAQFIQSMRQQYDLGSVPLAGQQRTWPGLKVVYQNQYGNERIAVIAQPTISTTSSSAARFVAIDLGDSGVNWGSNSPAGSTGGFHVYTSPDGINWRVTGTFGGFGLAGFSGISQVTTSVQINSFSDIFNYGQLVQTYLVTYFWVAPVTTKTRGPVPPPDSAFNGVGSFAAFGNNTYVIAGYYFLSTPSSTADNTNASVTPIFRMSGDGNTWKEFTPPIIGAADPVVQSNLSGPLHAPYASNCWFDDGFQRTTTNGVMDGTPTNLWFSSLGMDSNYDPVGTLYSSADLVTWRVDTSHAYGFNGDGKTDGVHIGSELGRPPPFNDDIFYRVNGVTATCFGLDATGQRIGVDVSRSQETPGQITNNVQTQAVTINVGPATSDPSTWTTVTLPMPSVVFSLSAEISYFDSTVEDADEIAFTTAQAAAWATQGVPGNSVPPIPSDPDSQAFAEAEYESQLAYLESTIPAPEIAGQITTYEQLQISPVGVISSVRNGVTTWVIVGQIISEVAVVMGVIWTSKDGQTWTCVNDSGKITGVSTTEAYWQETVSYVIGDTNGSNGVGDWLYPFGCLVSGTPLYQQTFPTTPAL